MLYQTEAVKSSGSNKHAALDLRRSMWSLTAKKLLAAHMRLCEDQVPPDILAEEYFIGELAAAPGHVEGFLLSLRRTFLYPVLWGRLIPPR